MTASAPIASLLAAIATELSALLSPAPVAAGPADAPAIPFPALLQTILDSGGKPAAQSPIEPGPEKVAPDAAPPSRERNQGPKSPDVPIISPIVSPVIASFTPEAALPAVPVVVPFAPAAPQVTPPVPPSTPTIEPQPVPSTATAIRAAVEQAPVYPAQIPIVPALPAPVWIRPVEPASVGEAPKVRKAQPAPAAAAPEPPATSDPRADFVAPVDVSTPGTVNFAPALLPAAPPPKVSPAVAEPETVAAPIGLRPARERAPKPAVQDPAVIAPAPVQTAPVTPAPPAPIGNAPEAAPSLQTAPPEIPQPATHAPEAAPAGLPAPGLPPVLKKILDQGMVPSASGPSIEYLKRTYDRTEPSFETRYVAVPAAKVENAAAPPVLPSYGPVKLPVQVQAVHSTGAKHANVVPEVASRQPSPAPSVGQAPADHPDPNPDADPHPQQNPDPSTRRIATEDKPENSAAPSDAPPVHAMRVSDAPVAPAAATAASPEMRTASEPPARPEAPRPGPSDFEPVRPPQEISAPKTAAARDIRLELASGERRVEVRLSERAGELHLAVRTPDEHLSGALRDNLPTLSSRLEQAGFRSEPAAAALSSAVRSQVEQPAAATNTNFTDGREFSQGQGQGQQGQGQQHQDRRRPQSPFNPEEQPNRKQKGQEFAWLVSSLT